MESLVRRWATIKPWEYNNQLFGSQIIDFHNYWLEFSLRYENFIEKLIPILFPNF